MDSSRDGSDVDREEVHELGAGGGESSAEYASLALSDNKGECEEASAGEHATSLVVNGAGSGCEEATSPAVVNSDSGGVLATANVDVEGVGHEDEGEKEEDGYVTPTSPRHRLQAPAVCPPAPWPRRVLMSPVSPPARRPRRARMTPVASAAGGTRGRKRIRAERDNLGRWRESLPPVARRLLFTDVDTDELLSVFVERRRRVTTRSQQ
ncbi:hypothetical protein ABZP36_011666 [Zizania latifolia]